MTWKQASKNSSILGRGARRALQVMCPTCCSDGSPRVPPKVPKYLPRVLKWRRQASQMTALGNHSELKWASGRGRSPQDSLPTTSLSLSKRLYQQPHFSLLQTLQTSTRNDLLPTLDFFEIIYRKRFPSSIKCIGRARLFGQVWDSGCLPT